MSQQAPFHNTQVEVGQLPSIADLNLHLLEPNYKLVRLIQWLIWALVFSIAFAVVYINFPFEEHIYILFNFGFPLLVVFLIFLFVLAYFGYFQMSYALREKDIFYKKGLIFRKSTVIPFNRIQHCEVNHGPIDRFFGLASLKIFTAGGVSSDLSIPGLSESKAHSLKDYIVGKTGLDEEE